MQRTKIEYLTHTWNPIGMKCTPVSDGCLNCWHRDLISRFGLKDEGLREKELEAPLHVQKPARIGVQFMGDLFHESVPFEWIDRIWMIAAVCPRHTFKWLTKRVKKARNYFEDRIKQLPELAVLPNLWLGATVCTQKEADEKIPIHLDIPAAVHYVSIEPCLEDMSIFPTIESYQLDWVIVGPETGPGARPCKIEWIRSIVHQCKEVGVSCFVKKVPVGKNQRDWGNMDLWPEEGK